MSELILFANDLIEVIEENNKVYVKTNKLGFSLKEFDGILTKHPRIKLTNFALLKSVLTKETSKPVEIGTWLPNIEIEIAHNKMSASIIINETRESIKENIEKLGQDIKRLLAENKITHGILPIDLMKADTGKAIEIAKGTEPINGEDAIVKYLEIPERKPVIREDGKADYFDMNFIFEIKEGSWLGEKIPAQPGIPGTNVHGEPVPAPHGKDVPLKYDKKSAVEVEEEGKIVLKALNNGVLEERQGMISISRHLPINGDVGLETGNIQFDGSISIRGTVQNGYTVIASGDISIEHPEGVIGAKLIHSTGGDVYIRGGIFGLGETVVEAGKNIFVKHVNEANLIAGEEIVIGSYALGSNLYANTIKVDERKGKLIGGRAVAKDTIITAISGNRLERKTELIIESVSKKEKQEMIQEKASLLKALHEEIVQISSQLNAMNQYQNKMNDKQMTAFNHAKQLVEKKKNDAELVDEEIKKLMKEFHASAKEEIVVRKEAYPGTYIQIGKKSTTLSKMTNGTFRLENGELNA